jgi:hypothetical protein
MYCPACGDEFRPGFTRCGRCNVDLVVEQPAARQAPAPARAGATSWVEYCGFFALDDARRARDDLRAESIRSEIVIREQPEADPRSVIREEYWLRVDSERVATAARILGEQPQVAAAPEADTFNCSECGETVAADESFCPHCGARFEDAG